MNTQKPGSEQGEDLNVRQVHGQLVREKSEPREMLRAIPPWLKHGIYAPLMIWGIIYLVTASGGFNWNEYNEGPRSTLKRVASSGSPKNASAPPAKMIPKQTATVDLRAEGAKVYQSVCIACHQSTGMGLPGVFPPLAGSDWVNVDDRKLALVVLHGLMGPIEVKGQAWNGVMPSQGANLTDRQIAAALSYVRSEWGIDAPQVDPATVAKMRKEFGSHAMWTGETLNQKFEPQ